MKNTTMFILAALLTTPLLSNAGMLDDAKAQVRQDSEKKVIASLGNSYEQEIAQYKANPNRSGPKCYLAASEKWSMWTGMPKTDFDACDTMVKKEIIAIREVNVRQLAAEKVERADRRKDSYTVAAKLDATDQNYPRTRATVVHMGDQSCISQHFGQETVISCGTSSEITDRMYEDNARVLADRQLVAKKRRQELEEEWQSKKDDVAFAAMLKEQQEEFSRETPASLFAKNPEGWGCVKKQLKRGVNIMSAPQAAIDACHQEFIGTHNEN